MAPVLYSAWPSKVICRKPFSTSLTRLPQESSVVITGPVREDKRAPGIPGGYEVGVKEIKIVQLAGENYPMALKEQGVDFALDNRHLWIRMPSQWAILRVRATVIAAIREWFEQNGFINMDTPILTPAAVEGTTTLFETEYFDEGKAYLSQSGQLYNEANIMAFGKVYCFGPTFRAEKSKTRRHLTEFWMVEPEMAFCDLDQLMEIGGTVCHPHRQARPAGSRAGTQITWPRPVEIGKD